tara:strand:- start:7950 stop:8357 length:408 start_codon:yes stop_codon:yes gene_type:complete
MADAAITTGLQILQRQYFQLVEPHQLRWPESAMLKRPDVQNWLFANMFDLDKVKSPPPDRYQLRVLKLVISKLEGAIVDPEEDVRPPVSYHDIARRSAVFTVTQSRSIPLRFPVLTLLFISFANDHSSPYTGNFR